MVVMTVVMMIMFLALVMKILMSFVYGQVGGIYNRREYGCDNNSSDRCDDRGDIMMVMVMVMMTLVMMVTIVVMVMIIVVVKY
jgi:hypothetical protein